MNKKALKIIIGIGMFVIISLIMTTISNAASLGISAPSTVSPGETFTVTITLNNGAGPVSASVSNGAGGFSDWLENGSSSFSCTAGSSGSVTISASGTVGDFSTGNDEKVSASKSITIKQPDPIPEPPPSNNNGGTTSKPNNNTNNNTTEKPTETKKSNNSRLGTLKIAEGILTPEFDSKINEYTINVPNEVTKLSIEAILEDSKASIKITGNEELKIGENLIEVIVTAEDGSTNTYSIRTIRADAELGLQSLNIFYIDENGEKIQLELNPIYTIGMLEYTLKELSYKIDSLIIEAIATRENAKIEIMGHENLKTGENIITIKVIDNTELEETEETENEVTPKEEKVYIIKVSKESEPVVAPLTTMQKIKNWFSGAGIWISDNLTKIQAVALIIATTLFIGLTVYFMQDYKNYKKLVAQLAEINKTNLMEKANFALNGEEKITETNSENEEEKIEIKHIEEKDEKSETLNENKNTLLDKFMKQDEEGKSKPERGRRFKK